MSSLIQSISELYWNFPSAERKAKENAGKTLQSSELREGRTEPIERTAEYTLKKMEKSGVRKIEN